MNTVKNATGNDQIVVATHTNGASMKAANMPIARAKKRKGAHSPACAIITWILSGWVKTASTPARHAITSSVTTTARMSRDDFLM